ncbi:MAG: hypothetical protein JW807_11330 [Spirochaetes bacterium]|nr:hypothetical protein [Spirochaetota bacterium]
MFRKNYIIIGTLILFVAIVASGSNGQNKYQWKLDGTKAGCTIYYSEVPGREYVAAKATGIINAPMDVVGMVLRDIPSYPEWMADCNATKILKVVNDDKDIFVLWYHQHVPLLADRDMVLKSNVVLAYGKGWSSIGVSSTNEVPYPTPKGMVRMISFSGSWLLEWVDDNTTRATFTIDPNLGPGLPVGIANSTIKKNTYKSIAGMRKMVKKQKYIDGAKKSKYRKMINAEKRRGGLKNKTKK